MNIVNLKKRIYTSITLLLLLFLIFKFKFILIFSMLILGIYSILEFFNIIKKIFNGKLILFFLNISFITYVSIFCLVFLFFSNFHQLKVILFSILLCCIASDIGGYIFGNIFKGKKLTKISPKKTISGAVGSLILSSLFILSLVFYYTNAISFKVLIIGVLTSLGCQLGDLFFSLLKRKAKLNDTGNFLPGHGGVLDRLDGIFLGVPVGLIALIFLY
jgi:phosphatidate cytidylyltransferase